MAGIVTETRVGRQRLLPFAGELEGALADWLGEGLVRRDGGEPFARGLALGSQTVDQTQGLTLRSQFWSPRTDVPPIEPAGDQPNAIDALVRSIGSQ